MGARLGARLSRRNALLRPGSPHSGDSVVGQTDRAWRDGLGHRNSRRRGVSRNNNSTPKKKPMSISLRSRTTVCLGMAVTLLLSHSQLSAMPRLSREISGIVQAIDSETLTLLPDGKTELLLFAWEPKWTQFVRNREFASPNSLRPGTRVEVRYHSPFFGPRFVTRVFWQVASFNHKPGQFQRANPSASKHKQNGKNQND